MTKETCDLLEKAKKLPFNVGKELTCSIIATCKRNICLTLSDVDQLQIDQMDPNYPIELPNNDIRIV